LETLIVREVRDGFVGFARRLGGKQGGCEMRVRIYTLHGASQRFF
jgi:hypothetical protein